MRLKYKISGVALFLCLSIAVSVSAATVAIPDRPYNHVVDLAGIVNDDTESTLNRFLLDLEQKTTAQLVILTINSLEGESIEALSIDIAHNRWKLGQKNIDNGVLLLVAFQDRKYRFEVGYGLEGILPDSYMGSIGRQYILPNFKKGDYSNGIATAAIVVVKKIASGAGVEITGMPELRSPSPNTDTEHRKPSLLGRIFSILFFIGLIYFFIRHPRLLLFFIMMTMMGGGRRDGWGSGGGFGGGGGGGFGGGGASGGW